MILSDIFALEKGNHRNVRENTAYFCGCFFMFEKLIYGIFAVAGDFKTPFYRKLNEAMPVASLTDSNAVMAWTASDYYSIINAMLY